MSRLDRALHHGGAAVRITASLERVRLFLYLLGASMRVVLSEQPGARSPCISSEVRQRVLVPLQSARAPEPAFSGWC